MSKLLQIKHTLDDDDPLERGSWSSKLDFILSVVGLAIGLGKNRKSSQNSTTWLYGRILKFFQEMCGDSHICVIRMVVVLS